MKNNILFFLLLAILSCNTKTGEPVPAINSTTLNRADTPTVIMDTHYFWNADWEGKKGMVMKKVSPISEDSLTASIIIEKLNRLYPEIKLQYKNTSGDTIFVFINKSTYLTQQLGSSGAEAYLAEVTYNLTELKNTNYVDIRFKEGDHASPGIYSRTDFVK